MVDVAPPESRILEVSGPSLTFMINVLVAKWDEADEARMQCEPMSMDETYWLERQQMIEGLQRQLR